MRQLQLNDVVVGQYKGHMKDGKAFPSYLNDPTVPENSLTPTFAAASLFIDNARWDGVPFLMKAGKALHTKRYDSVILSFAFHALKLGFVPEVTGNDSFLLRIQCRDSSAIQTCPRQLVQAKLWNQFG